VDVEGVRFDLWRTSDGWRVTSVVPRFMS
jgi:hypothetical protein